MNGFGFNPNFSMLYNMPIADVVKIATAGLGELPKPYDISQAQAAEQPSWYSRLSNFINNGGVGGLLNPGALSYMLGSLGAAISPEGSWQRNVGNVAANMGASMQMSEAYKKLLRQVLANQGFQSSPNAIGLGGADVLGLSPDIIKEVYGTALKTKANEQKTALDTITTLGNALVNMAQAGYYPALAEQARAGAGKTQAETKKIEAETELTSKLGAKKMQADIDKILAETSESRAKAAYYDPAFQRELAQLKVLNEKVTPAMKNAADKAVAPLFLEHAKNNYVEMMKGKPGFDEAKAVADFMAMIKDPMTQNINPAAIIAYLSPEDRKLFSAATGAVVVDPIGGYNTALQLSSVATKVSRSQLQKQDIEVPGVTEEQVRKAAKEFVKKYKRAPKDPNELAAFVRELYGLKQ